MHPRSPVDPFVRALWGILGHSGTSCGSLLDRAVAALGGALLHVAPRVVIASHYTSWYHRSAATGEGDRLAARVRDGLRDMLRADPHFRLPSQLNGDGWIVAFRA
jgi:hypothetical protein